MRRWLIVAVASVLAIGGGLLIWRTVTDPLPGATAAAQRAATALTERTITDGAFGGTAGPAEVADLTATLRGMGTLRPTITVDDVQLNDDGRRATARLRADWVIHAGKPPWVQEAYLSLVRGADGWSAVWSRELIASGLRPGDRVRAVRLAPVRGEVIGAGDERLVWNQDAKRIGLDKTLVPPQRQGAAATKLAQAVGIDPETFVQRVALNGPRAYVEAAVVRAVGDESWRVLAKARTVEGVRIQDVTRPLALSPTFARQVLGSVGEATDQIIRTSGGSIRQGDLVGLGGLQRAHNTTLMGVTGFVVQAYPDGHVEQARDLFRVPAVNGGPLRVTLDATRQRAAEAALAGRPGRGAVVLIRPSDGAVLALASTPGGTAATSQRVFPKSFPPVTGLPGADPVQAIEALGLTGDGTVDGLPVFLAGVDGGTVRLSPFAMAAATASIVKGATVRPELVVGSAEPAASGIDIDQAVAVRRALAEPIGERTWAVAVRGDLAIAVYDSEAKASALLATMLRA